MKRLGVTAEPQLISFNPESDGQVHAFMALITDGITSVLSDQEIVDVVKESRDPHHAASSIVKLAEELGTEDNSTAIVIRLSGWGSKMPDLTKEIRDYRRSDAAQLGARRR
jgi:protein phosphatase PTC6